MDVLTIRLKRNNTFLRTNNLKYSIDNSYNNQLINESIKENSDESKSISKEKTWKIDENTKFSENEMPKIETCNTRRVVRYSTLVFNDDSFRDDRRKGSLEVKNSLKSEIDLEIPLEFQQPPSLNDKPMPNKFCKLSDQENLEQITEKPETNIVVSNEDKLDTPQLSSYNELSNLENSIEDSLQVQSHQKKMSLTYEDITYISLQHFSPSKYANSINKTFDILYTASKDKIIQVNSYENNEELANKPPPQEKEQEKSLKSSLLERIDISLLNFEEAVAEFHSFSYSSTEKNIWLKPWYSFFTSCCITENKLTEKNQEICEKFIIFAYSVYLKYDIYHKNLLATVSYLLRSRVENSEKWSDIGFSNNNPIANDLIHHTSVAGLLFIIFLDRYFPLTLTEILFYSLENDFAFVPLAFDIGEMVIISLRKHRLNQLILDSEKCLEIIFFIFAGCIGFWFSSHKDNPRSPSTIHAICEDTLNKNSYFFIALAKQLLKKQFIE